MHKALYREFRPGTFDELIGQDHIVRILKNQIKSGNVGHAYLFCGTRGTGKTTTARILAKALNCTGEGEKPCCSCDNCRAIAEGSYVDVIEVDAASNNGVDNIRDLTESVMYAPGAGRYKVYIIDEVHMLSQGAFNALLKTLEEPPEYVVFILATTEPQKVPATIMSRCLRLDFRRVSEKDLMENMRHICDARGIEAEDSALALIAVNADGSVRDSLSILEQCIVPGEPLKRNDVASVIGTAGEGPLLELTDRVLDGDTAGALLMLNDIVNSGVDIKNFMKEWLEHFRNLLISKYVADPSAMLSMSDENAARVKEQAERIPAALLDRAVRELTETISLTKWAKRPRVMLEMSIVKLASGEVETPGPESGQREAGRAPGAEASGRGPGAGNMTRPPCRPAGRIEGGSPAGAGGPGQMQAVPPAAAPARPQEPAADRPYRPAENPAPARQNNRPAEPPISGGQDRAYAQGGPAAPQAQQQAGAASSAGPSACPSAFTAEDWAAAVNAAASNRGLLIRLVDHTHFDREEDGRIYVTCDDDPTLDLLKDRGAGPMRKALSDVTGRQYEIIAEVKKFAPSENADRGPKKEKAELDEFFGIDVKVK